MCCRGEDKNCCFSFCAGGLLHRHIPLPAAPHHLHPWSDAPRGWRRAQVLPHPWLQQACRTKCEGSTERNQLIMSQTTSICSPHTNQFRPYLYLFYENRLLLFLPPPLSLCPKPYFPVPRQELIQKSKPRYLYRRVCWEKLPHINHQGGFSHHLDARSCWSCWRSARCSSGGVKSLVWPLTMLICSCQEMECKGLPCVSLQTHDYWGQRSMGKDCASLYLIDGTIDPTRMMWQLFLVWHPLEVFRVGPVSGELRPQGQEKRSLSVLSWVWPCLCFTQKETDMLATSSGTSLRSRCSRNGADSCWKHLEIMKLYLYFAKVPRYRRKTAAIFSPDVFKWHKKLQTTQTVAVVELKSLSLLWKSCGRAANCLASVVCLKVFVLISRQNRHFVWHEWSANDGKTFLIFIVVLPIVVDFPGTS